MATRLPETDAVLIGVGLVGTHARPRADARRPARWSAWSAASRASRCPTSRARRCTTSCATRCARRLMQDNTKETVTFRNNGEPDGAADPALGKLPARHRPGRRGGALERPDLPLPGHRLPHAQRTTERYGKNFLDARAASIQDWGVTAADLEPYYDRFEYLLGTSGKAGNLKGKKIAGGNPFEDPRSRDYPTPPQKEPYGSAHVPQGRGQPGLPPVPAAVVEPEPAVHQSGRHDAAAPACSAAICERYGCEHYAKSSPQTDPAAGAAEGQELHLAHAVPGAAHQPAKRQEAGDRRHLRRRAPGASSSSRRSW